MSGPVISEEVVLIDTGDFLRQLTRVLNDRMGDVDLAEFCENWPDDDAAIRVELTDGQCLTFNVEVTR